MITDKDKEYMKLALDLAAKGMGYVNPNPMVGAVIVKDNTVLGYGYHMKYGEGHAEVNAFNNVQESDVSGATMYVTLEPCSHYGKTPPCAKKIVEKKIKRVVIGTLDPNPLVAGRGVKILKDAGIEVEWGVLDKECLKLNEIFMKYIVTNRPFVLMKSAMSLDGKIATKTGDSKWISCEQSRKNVHVLRKMYSAIMVGVNTVIKDNPSLTCRIDEGVNPIRIIVDSNLRTPIDSNIVKTAKDIKTIIACTNSASLEDINKLESMDVQVIKCMENNKKKVSLVDLMKKLGELGIDSILLEGGSTLNFSALQSKIVDKVQIYIAPKIIGGNDASGPVAGIGIDKINEAFKLKDLEYKKIGQDILVEGYIDK